MVVATTLEAAPSTSVSVKFSVKGETGWGEVIGITGGHELLGNWSSPIKFDCQDSYPTWKSSTISLPAGKPIEFKFVKVAGDSITWEPIEGNRSFLPHGEEIFVEEEFGKPTASKKGAAGIVKLTEAAPTEPAKQPEYIPVTPAAEPKAESNGAAAKKAESNGAPAKTAVSNGASTKTNGATPEPKRETVPEPVAVKATPAPTPAPAPTATKTATNGASAPKETPKTNGGGKKSKK